MAIAIIAVMRSIIVHREMNRVVWNVSPTYYDIRIVVALEPNIAFSISSQALPRNRHHLQPETQHYPF